MSVLNEIPCAPGECLTCDVLQRAGESREAWFSRLRLRIASAPRTCEGIAAHPWAPENVRTRTNGSAYCIPCARQRRRERVKAAS